MSYFVAAKTKNSVIYRSLCYIKSVGLEGATKFFVVTMRAVGAHEKLLKCFS